MEKKYVVQTAEQWYGNELVLYAQRYLVASEHKQIKADFLELNLLNESNLSAAEKRIGRISRRAMALGAEGLRLLANARPDDQAALVLMSYLEAYRFPYEFVFEFLILRLERINRNVFVSEFDRFYQNKNLQDPDSIDWSESSRKRMRIQVFSILTKGRLLEKKSTEMYLIQQLLLSDEVTAFFARRSPYHLMI